MVFTLIGSESTSSIKLYRTAQVFPVGITSNCNILIWCKWHDKNIKYVWFWDKFHLKWQSCVENFSGNNSFECEIMLLENYWLAQTPLFSQDNVFKIMQFPNLVLGVCTLPQWVFHFICRRDTNRVYDTPLDFIFKDILGGLTCILALYFVPLIFFYSLSNSFLYFLGQLEQ